MEPSQLNRIEIAIDKLTAISSNLDKLIGVHDTKLVAQEKQLTNIDNLLEKRREIQEEKFNDVYDKMHVEDKNILEEFANFKKENKASEEKLIARINKLEKSIYYYTGGLAVISFLLTYGQSFVHFFAVLNTTSK